MVETSVVHVVYIDCSVVAEPTVVLLLLVVVDELDLGVPCQSLHLSCWASVWVNWGPTGGEELPTAHALGTC